MPAKSQGIDSTSTTVNCSGREITNNRTGIMLMIIGIILVIVGQALEWTAVWGLGWILDVIGGIMATIGAILFFGASCFSKKTYGFDFMDQVKGV